LESNSHTDAKGSLNCPKTENRHLVPPRHLSDDLDNRTAKQRCAAVYNRRYDGVLLWSLFPLEGKLLPVEWSYPSTLDWNTQTFSRQEVNRMPKCPVHRIDGIFLSGMSVQ
jgi:hypothetical protein